MAAYRQRENVKPLPQAKGIIKKHHHRHGPATATGLSRNAKLALNSETQTLLNSYTTYFS